MGKRESSGSTGQERSADIDVGLNPNHSNHYTVSCGRIFRCVNCDY